MHGVLEQVDKAVDSRPIQNLLDTICTLHVQADTTYDTPLIKATNLKHYFFLPPLEPALLLLLLRRSSALLSRRNVLVTLLGLDGSRIAQLLLSVRPVENQR